MELSTIIIAILHISFVSFVITIPFIGSNYLLLLHAIVVPFMIFHWIVNNNTCALTIIENQLRCTISGVKKPISEAFTYKLIAPVYDFNKDNAQYSKTIYILTISLWFITMGRIYYKYHTGEIKSFKDMLKI